VRDSEVFRGPISFCIYDARRGAQPIIGRVIAIGYLDEFDERAYAIVDGIDGRAHHVPLGKRDPGELKPGSIVEVRPTQPRVADRNIAALSRGGFYLTSEHRDLLRSRDDRQIDPEEIVDAHVRRLEALRRAGIVERLEEGIWRVPADLVARGRAYDQRRTGGLEIKQHSDLPLDNQVNAMGATWLVGMHCERARNFWSSKGSYSATTMASNYRRTCSRCCASVSSMASRRPSRGHWT
jgi:hypothetical protein